MTASMQMSCETGLCLPWATPGNQFFGTILNAWAKPNLWAKESPTVSGCS